MVALGFVGVLALAAATPFDAEAKRMGGGQSIGRQSQMAPSPSGQGQRAQQAQPAQQAGQAPAATQARNRWMGPLAGLAAGLGIAALLSQFGLGEGLAQFLSNALLIAMAVFAGVMLFRFIARKRPDLAASHGAGGRPNSALSRLSNYAQQLQTGRSGPTSSSEAVGATNALKPGSLPIGFDQGALLTSVKALFMRLQAAWDTGDQGDLFEFMTPDMFAQVKMDLETRGSLPNRTDVRELDVELLGVEVHAGEMLASVRFHGRMQEAEGEIAQPFQEVWNVVRDSRGEKQWRLAGIQQLA